MTQKETPEDQLKGEKKKLKTRLRFVGALLLIKRLYKRVGNSLLLNSYPEYLRVRDRYITGGYKIELQSNHDQWKEAVEVMKSALIKLPSSETWTSIEWVGSTTVPGLVAKPVIDLMITVGDDVDVKEATTLIAIETANKEWVQEESKGFELPLGFLGEFMGGDWGFLQFPHYAAKAANLVECNVHVFNCHDNNATDKILMRDYLLSEAGEHYIKEYADIKLKLESDFKEGQMDAKDYNKGKNDIIQKIMQAAFEWDGQKVETSKNETKWFCNVDLCRFYGCCHKSKQ